MIVKLFDFQEEAVNHIINKVTTGDKHILTIKSPTGSGKTIILINTIEQYLDNVDGNTAFVWLCPGKGDLEEQSMAKMQKFAPSRAVQDLQQALLQGFAAGSTTFINWEAITKTGNRAITEGEQKNLFDRIAEAHRANIKFIIVIDEEHSNNTSKAKEKIDAFSAIKEIRMSATAKLNPLHDFYEIKEEDVINAGLITKAIYVNDDIQSGSEVGDDYEDLLVLADEKRKLIAQEYRNRNLDIRPLVLIQFPNGQPQTIKMVEEKLASMGYTYDNGMVSIWMSGDKKDLAQNLIENNGDAVFLLMKQAINTGWDCPRAKILVKLREGMNEDFEIQTVGRIRRMPERKHYENDLLDFCYVYTYDEKWKNGLFNTIEHSYERIRLFLKDKCKTFTIKKQLRDLDQAGLGVREVWIKIHDYFVQKYHLTSNKAENKTKLETSGYIFGTKLQKQLIQGKFIKTDELEAQPNSIAVTKVVNTHKNGIDLLHCVDIIKSAMSMRNQDIKLILERLFKKGKLSTKKLCGLETAEFYAFIINNVKKLRDDFVEVTNEMSRQLSMTLAPKTMDFKMPHEDIFNRDPTFNDLYTFESNSYEEYTSQNVFGHSGRSKSERLFEVYCEGLDSVEWVYKNHDKGQKYHSIVYSNNLLKQYLFYPDYIIKMKDGTIWIIETKGGETASGQSLNIDKKAKLKFDGFKQYAEQYGYKWGFVRNKDESLFINNTEYTESMDNEHWIPLRDVLK